MGAYSLYCPNSNDDLFGWDISHLHLPNLARSSGRPSMQPGGWQGRFSLSQLEGMDPIRPDQSGTIFGSHANIRTLVTHLLGFIG